MIYTLRTKTGELKAELSEPTANRLISEAGGDWHNVKYTDGSKVYRCTIKHNMVLSIRNYFFRDTKLFIWEGDRLEIPAK